MNNYNSPRISNELCDCSLPMTFDTYNKCSYNCLYCFSNFQRVFNSYKKNIKKGKKDLTSVNVEKIKDLFLLKSNNKNREIFSFFIKNKKVMQWGGLADQFDEYERKHGITLELLKFFKEINYPLCFSTKAVWWLKDNRYLDLFKGQDNWNCKFSIINLNKEKASKMEIGCPSPQDRLEAIKIYSELNNGGATLRLRPFIIGLSDRGNEYLELIKMARKNGADAVSIEFLCLDGRNLKEIKLKYNLISDIIGFDILDFYNKNSQSRQYLRLNRYIKEPYIKKMYELCQKLNMRFYVSDAHFKELCNNGSCCGLSDNWNYSRGQFTEALLIAKRNGKVYFSDIEKNLIYLKDIMWTKSYKPINNFERFLRYNQSLYDFILEIWNTPNNGKSPYKYFGGILKPIGLDNENNVIYEYNKDLSIKNI